MVRILAPPAFLMFNEYYKSHAYALSHTILSPIPSDVLYIILRMVPTSAYLRAYDDPIFGSAPDADLENRSYPWGSDHRMFGDY